MRIFLLGTVALMLAGCFADKSDSRGLRYMPDMYQSPAWKSQEAWVIDDVDADGNPIRRQVPVMLQPPDGTVPRDMIAYDLGPGDLEQADQRRNPLPPDANTLRLGRDKYEQFCMVCHGRDGNAGNALVANYFQAVPSLNTSVAASYSDGRIYHWITLGRGRMPDYAAQLMPHERWAVIHYLRTLLTANERQGDSDLPAGEEFEALPVPEYQQAFQAEDEQAVVP